MSKAVQNEQLNKALAANLNALENTLKAVNVTMKGLRSGLSSDDDGEDESADENDESEDDADEDESDDEDEAEHTHDDVVAAFKKYAAKNSKEKAMKILRSYGVSSVIKLKPKQYADVMAKLNLKK